MSSVFDDAAQRAWAGVKDDASEMHWLIVRTSDDGKTASLVGSGTGGYGGFMGTFKAQPPGVMCGIFRVRAIDERGTVRSVRAKFVRINVVSEGLPVMKRARGVQIKPHLDSFFSGCHTSVDTDNLNRVNKETLVRQLLQAGGAHAANLFEFNGADADDGDETAAPASPPPPPPPPPAPVAPTSSIPLDTVEGCTVAEAWERIRGNLSPINWVLLSYDGKDPKSAYVVYGGKGGLDDLKAHLDSDKVLFGGFRVTAIDDRGSVRSVRSKFAFVSYAGPEVRPMVRAQAGMARTAIQQMLPGCHVALALNTPAELNPRELEMKLQASCGAHKPNGYDFGEKVKDGEP